MQSTQELSLVGGHKLSNLYMCSLHACIWLVFAHDHRDAARLHSRSCNSATETRGVWDIP